jgi:hypothetical protein
MSAATKFDWSIETTNGRRVGPENVEQGEGERVCFFFFLPLFRVYQLAVVRLEDILLDATHAPSVTPFTPMIIASVNIEQRT